MSDRRDRREENLERAIEMTDVTLRICLDSIRNKYPKIDEERLTQLFIERVRGSRNKSDVKDN